MYMYVHIWAVSYPEKQHLHAYVDADRQLFACDATGKPYYMYADFDQSLICLNLDSYQYTSQGASVHAFDEKFTQKRNG